ncbi:MAG: SDR family NAD(P)-dependent oxidoreductase [Alphaproteobacteria bacterium]|nr:SDR family NAD(P)-dependent oxidoreductase [Alphaproteobacteria bacterium]
MAAPRRVLITGASSGIGAALAAAYAAPGVTLHLSGRDAARLGAAAATARAAGAEVEEAIFDVRDIDAVRRWIEAAASAGPLDLVIANAGISAGTGGAGESAAQARAIFDVNVGGVLNTVLPAVAAMRAQAPRGDGTRGQVAIISSLAAFVYGPTAPAYFGSKAAVRAWGESLAGMLRAERIGVSVVCPGFIATPMTSVNPYPMPGLMGAERAARIIRRGLARGRVRIAFPWFMYAAVRLLGALPPWIALPLFARAPGKPADPALR